MASTSKVSLVDGTIKIKNLDRSVEFGAGFASFLRRTWAAKKRVARSRKVNEG
jgi:hypothetical protein